MFSIAAINDTDSKNRWQPLAPTKEAQEFRISQLYHDGLLRLQDKDYEKARELLESVLKDPLLQTQEEAGDGHLLQLRFLALKNLGTVFLQPGLANYESALHCYLQAVEIDRKDYVVWNQLGTLSCSMGLMSISRWAFEQGLVCSPNNWNCMEKLLEVLIFIGDEVACLSVAELILTHWPSHSRALHVKSTVQNAKTVPFTPKGIDKLEPSHKRLKFPVKRIAEDECLDRIAVSKKLKQSIDIQLSEVSWVSLVERVLEILLPLHATDVVPVSKNYVSGDVRLNILLPSLSDNVTNSVDMKESTWKPSDSGTYDSDCNAINDKEGTLFDEQPQERRSSRLERLRTRKPGKEDSNFSSNKDVAKVVKQYLLPYLIDGTRTTHHKNDSNVSLQGAEKVTDLSVPQYDDIFSFIQSNVNNSGAYHMSHLLLEKIANGGILYQDSIEKILDLEKVARSWGQVRTPECSLFLSEIYYDAALRSSESSEVCSFMLEASFHLCKIIESFAHDFPFPGINGIENCIKTDASEQIHQITMGDFSLLRDNHCFWIRYFWLSARLSLFQEDEERAQKEFSVVSWLFLNKDKENGALVPICFPHCKAIKELTLDQVLHEINLIEIKYLLKNTVGEMLEKNMYSDCAKLLAPLLLSTNNAHFDLVYTWDHEGKGFNSIELSALDILIKSCELAKPMDVDVFLDCHRRKLQILLAGAGLEGSSVHKLPGFNASFSEGTSKESLLKNWSHLVADEVRAISQSASEIKTNISCCENFKKLPMEIIGDIQSLLLTLMCNISNLYVFKKSSGMDVPDSHDQTENSHFVDASIAFCKLQHLDLSAPIKCQTELVVAIHDMLAEFGICCARGNGDAEEGTFLKLAIKHLLALDMKLKSNIHSVHIGLEAKAGLHTDSDDHVKKWERISDDSHFPEPPNVSQSKTLDSDLGETDKIKVTPLALESVERSNSEFILPCLVKEPVGVNYNNNEGDVLDGVYVDGEKVNDQCIKCNIEPTDDEREELELGIDNALDQCFYCLYGLNLRSDSSSEEDLVVHRNTCQGDYQTKEQCADVFQYILPYTKASSRTGLVKLRRVLRTIRKHFPQPPQNVLAENAIDKFLDNPDLCEEKLLEEAGSNVTLDSLLKLIFPEDASFKSQMKSPVIPSCDPYREVYSNLYFLLAQSEEMSATDKWAGFVLTKEGEDFVEQNAKLFKYDLLYSPSRFESWQRLANLYDEEVDLLLNDGSKQINVLEWRKNANLSQRVEASRRRSRRCLLMTLALAKTASQQGEIHELLALVYYDGLQNVVPFYDQRSVVPLKGAEWNLFCENAMDQFKKALKHKENWSYAFYAGKLCEKLGYSLDAAFSYYTMAIALNPSAVDPFYRMHASRLKLLYKCGEQNIEALKVVAAHSFSSSNKETVNKIFSGVDCESSDSLIHIEDRVSCLNTQQVELHILEKVWNLLYDDCISALETCVEGDLKHFHKARYMLAQGFYRRGRSEDLEKAKEELSFCFKSSRSLFTINMWEIDSTVNKGRRKTLGVCGNRRALEVNLAESSRKFITCIRKYMLFYLKLLEETGDISTLDRAYIFLRVDKRFSLCLEDLVPVALLRYVQALTKSLHLYGKDSAASIDSLEHLLEKLFNLFMERVNLWSDVCHLPELDSTELTESDLYRHLYDYIHLLERNVKVETLEGINEKIRKRLKNPKISNSGYAKIYRHVSASWCRSLVINMAVITPLLSRRSTDTRDMSRSGGRESDQLLCVDLQSEELWSSAFEDPNHLKYLETKWNPLLSEIKNVIIKRVAEEDSETAAALLRSSYNFYKDTSCALLPSGINLYMVPAQLVTETYIQPGIDGVDILDMNTSRKLLLWAYSLLHGHCPSVSHVIKYCEENTKSKLKKGAGNSSTPPNANTCPATACQSGVVKDGTLKSCEPESSSVPTHAAQHPETKISYKPSSSTCTEIGDVPKVTTTVLDIEKQAIGNSLTKNEGQCKKTADSQAGLTGSSSCINPKDGNDLM